MNLFIDKTADMFFIALENYQSRNYKTSQETTSFGST
jgi:hypothetical protein